MSVSPPVTALPPSTPASLVAATPPPPPPVRPVVLCPAPSDKADQSTIERWFATPPPNRGGPQSAETFGVAMSALALAASRTVVAPLERARLLLQAQAEVPRVTRPYSGLSDAVKRLSASEGVRSLWVGNATCVLRSVSAVALHRVTKDLVFPICTSLGLSDDLAHPASIAIAAGTSATILYPFLYSRTRLAVGFRDGYGGPRKSLALIARAYLDRGMFKGGLFAGFLAASLGLATYCGVSYAGFYAVRLADVSLPTCFVLGGLTTMAAQVVSYPLDTLTRRLMILGREIFHYDSVFAYVRSVVRHEGYSAFTRGLGLTLGHHSLCGAFMLTFFIAFPDAAVAY